MADRMHGIDISNYQAGLKLASTDAQFAIMKATEGVGYTDPYCDGFVNQAKKLGLPWGTYHFYAGGSGKAEADHYLKNIDGYVGDGIMVLDFERNTSNRTEPKAFLDRVHDQTGIWPILYISGSVANASGWTDVAKNCGLWIARWGTSSPGNTGPWSSAILWQHTDAYRTGGYTVDGDYFYGDKNTWQAYASGGKSKPQPEPEPQPTPPPEPQTDQGDDDMATAEHVKRHRGTNQAIKKADEEQWLLIDEDDAISLAIKPSKITGVLYLEISGMTPADSLYVSAGSYDVKKQSGANPWDAVTVNHPDRISGEQSGWAHKSIPIVWSLGSAEKGFDYRALRFRIKSNTTKAVIENARVECWVTAK